MTGSVLVVHINISRNIEYVTIIVYCSIILRTELHHGQGIRGLV